MNQAVLLLGCNIGNRIKNLEGAIQLLLNEVGCISKRSSVYESEPWGFESHNSFLNQVVIIETEISVEHLLKIIQAIEKKLGRVRTKKGYESRTMDIDILFYNNLILETAFLTVPHKALHERKFALEPLCEILPQKIHPVLQKTLKTLLKECEDNLWVKIFSN